MYTNTPDLQGTGGCAHMHCARCKVWELPVNGARVNPAGRASTTCTRAKENSVLANSGQLISLSALGPGLPLFLSQTAGSGVKVGSLFWSSCKKAKAQSLGTMTWTKTHPNQNLSIAFKNFGPNYKNQVLVHRRLHEVDTIWDHEVAKLESLLWVFWIQLIKNLWQYSAKHSRDRTAVLLKFLYRAGLEHLCIW